MKSILVTGTSSGIGRACALRLDGLGHRVYAGVRTQEHAKQLSELASGRLVPLLLDVTDQAQIEDAAARIGQDGDGLAGVVNNAGIGLTGPIEYLPVDTWRQQLDVNVIGQVAVTRAMLPLIRSGSGRVVFIGSIGGRAALMLFGPYSASKFAIEAISESLRYELRPWGIHACVVEPGAIKTAIWEKGRQDANRVEQDLPADARERYAAHLAALRKALDMQEKQAADPEKVAKAVEHALFARRPKTRYLVGTDARILTALVRGLPDKPREAIIGRMTGVRHSAANPVIRQKAYLRSCRTSGFVVWAGPGRWQVCRHPPGRHPGLWTGLRRSPSLADGDRAGADYMLASRLGPKAARRFAADIVSEAYDLAEWTSSDHAAALAVIDGQRDDSDYLGIADASNVILADRHRTTTILTLDQRHFRRLRPLWGATHFTMLPYDA